MEHLRLFEIAYGTDAVRPKHHYTLHIHAQIERHGTVYDAFTTERKHCSVKRIAGRVTNTKTFETTMLKLTQLYQERSLETTYLDGGLIPEARPWNDIMVSEQMYLDIKKLCANDIVRHGDEFVCVRACVGFVDGLAVLVTVGVFVRRPTPHSSVWTFSGDQLVGWATDISLAQAWYTVHGGVLVLHA